MVAVTECPELARARELEGRDGHALLLRVWNMLHDLEARLVGEARGVVLTANWRAFYADVEAGLTANWEEQYTLLQQAALLRQEERVPVPECGRKGGLVAESEADMLLHRACTEERRRAAERVSIGGKILRDLYQRAQRFAEIEQCSLVGLIEAALESYLDRGQPWGKEFVP